MLKNQLSLAINEKTVKSFNSKENEILQHFIDNTHVADFFKVERGEVGPLNEEVKFFVDKDSKTIDVTDVFGQVLELPVVRGYINLEGIGIDRASQAIDLMYCEIVKTIPAGLSKEKAIQSYETM